MNHSPGILHKNTSESDLRWIMVLSTVSLILRLCTNGKYGFHRDEFLYISQGQHLDWGFWSNPPGPGFFSWLTQSIIGDSLFAIRFVPALLGALTVCLTCLIAREMQGGRFAQLLAGTSIIISSAMPRVFLMYNPVPFEVFYWTLSAFLLLRYLNTKQGKYLIGIGITLGLGILNKYSMVFFAVPALIVLLLSKKHRSIIQSKHFWIAVFIAFTMILPNIYWQWNHNFPVFGHMNDLRQNQLNNVRLINFLLDQLLFNASILIIWLPGLWYLLKHEKGKSYGFIGWIFVLILVLIAGLKGKSYYTLGAFPMIFAAGACMWEYWTRHYTWPRIIPISISIFIFISLMPFSVPFLSLDKMVSFGKKVSAFGLDGILRWEDGQIHQLPQDYADMLGWQELALLADEAIDQIDDKTNYLVYGENYGQAGAINYYSSHLNGRKVVSFSDAFMLWAPTKIDTNIQHFIYVNNELGDDIRRLFSDIHLIGQVDDPYARTRSTSVFLCQKPRSSFAKFWDERVAQIKLQRNIP